MIDLLEMGMVATEISAKTMGEISNARAAAAGNFLAGGGHVTLTEWAQLSDDTRKALVAAQDAIERDRAALIAAMILRFQSTAQDALGERRAGPGPAPTSGPSASAAAQERAALEAASAAGVEA